MVLPRAAVVGGLAGWGVQDGVSMWLAVGTDAGVGAQLGLPTAIIAYMYPCPL